MQHHMNSEVKSIWWFSSGGVPLPLPLLPVVWESCLCSPGRMTELPLVKLYLVFLFHLPIETLTVNDPPDALDRQKCITALASLRHAKWFQVWILSLLVSKTEVVSSLIYMLFCLSVFHLAFVFLFNGS